MSSLLDAVGGGAVGLAVGEAASTVMEPALEAAKQEAWKKSQAKVLELDQLATLVAQALNAVDDVLDDAERNGFNKDQLSSAIQLALKAPGPPEADKLYLRAQGQYPGAITLAQLHHSYAKAGLEGQWWDALTAAAQNQLLTPAELALSIVRSTVKDPGLLVVTLDTSDSNVKQYPVAALNALDEAAAAGIDADRLRVLVGDVGLPMAVELAARAAFRGILTKGAYYQAVLEGDTRPEWADAIYEVAKQILTAHDYCELHLRGWITADQMYAGTALHGMTQADTDLLFDNIGRPIPVHQVTTGEARGGTYNGDTSQIPEAYLRAMQEGNTRPEWYNLEYANRYTYPSGFQIKAEAQAGDLSVDQTTQLLLQVGWSPEWAQFFAEKWAPTTTGGKALTVAQIKAAYKAGNLAQADALTQIEAHGYTPNDANLLLGIATQTAPPPVPSDVEIEALVAQGYTITEPPLPANPVVEALKANGYTVTPPPPKAYEPTVAPPQGG